MGDSPENSLTIFIRGGEPWLMGYCWPTYFKVLGVLFLDSIGFFISLVPEASITQGGKRRVRVARIQTKEGRMKRGKCGTTASSQTSSHPNSVHLDDATTEG